MFSLESNQLSPSATMHKLKITMLSICHLSLVWIAVAFLCMLSLDIKNKETPIKDSVDLFLLLVLCLLNF